MRIFTTTKNPIRMSSVLSTVADGVAYLTLNRPEKYNSINRDMTLTLQGALDDCANDETVRCIVITGAGKGFCSGQDLAEASDLEKLNFRQMVEEHYNALILRIKNLAKPVIAAVNGVAAGAGANLALACDIVIAAESATFIQAFSKIALIPDSGGTFYLPRLVGLQRAMGLMLTGDKVTAQEAAQMGMIYKALPDESFEAGYKLMAAGLSQMPTRALALTKQLLYQSAANTIEQQLEAEKEAQAKAGAGSDFREGIQAFLEKRKPVFTGK